MRIPLLLSFLSVVFLSSCTYYSQNYPPKDKDAIKDYEKTVTTPNPYKPQQPQYAGANALYTGDFNLFSDVKAHKRGDIVYVIVYESIDAIQKLATQTGKQTQINNAVSSFFGIPQSTLNKLSVGWKYQDQSKYAGSTQQSGMLTTKLAAYVKKVYPNGDMLIEATRYIYMNEMGHKIILRGIIRPQDIGPDNTIESYKIANLEIIYNGKGYAVDASSPGWFTRFLAAIWPF